MGIAKWLEHKGRRRSQGRAERRADRRQQALGLEGLEDRTVLSTILWTNRGSDNFAVEYGADADRARQIVDQALRQWEQTIVSFNYADIGTAGNAPENAYRLTINAGDLGIGGRGEVVAGSVRTDQQGKRYEATITLDDDAGGATNGWYFDTVLDAQGNNIFDHAEFADLDGRFRAADGTSSNTADLYRTILHEIGHAIGLDADAVAGVPGKSLTDVGTDQVNNSERLLEFVGTTRSYTFTTDGGGHLYEGPADPAFPGIARHPNDLMNDGRTVNNNQAVRQLITQTDTDLLRDAFGFTVLDPRESFQANLNRVTGVLTITGDVQADDGTIDRVDDIAIGNFTFGSSVVTVRITDNQPVLPLAFPVDQVREIIIDTGLDQDTILVDQFPATLRVTISAGTADDTIHIGTISATIDGLFLEIDGGPGDDTLLVSDTLGTAAQYGIFDGFLAKSNPGDIFFTAAIQYEGIDSLCLEGGNGGRSYNVHSTDADTPVTLVGGTGPDTFRISPRSGSSGGNLDAIAGSVTIDGGFFDDSLSSLLVDDQANAAGAFYVLSPGILGAPSKLTRTVGAKSVDISFSNIDDNLTLLGGEGDDTLAVTGVTGAIRYDPGAGNDTLGGMDASNVFRITATDAGTVSLLGVADAVTFTSTENLQGNAFDDTFRFANGARVSGRIDGLGGSDTLDYSAYTTGVIVDMVAGTATGTGGIVAIENVIGGSAVDNFTGDGADNTFLVSGVGDIIDAGGGSDTLVGMAAGALFSVTDKDAGTVSRPGQAGAVAFRSVENLRGGSGDDIFRFANGARVSGRIDGLGGSDTLDYSAYTTGVNIHMILGLATGIGSGGTFRIGTIENAIGGSAVDNLVGDGADNILLGNGGDDNIDARDGNDIVVGGDGDDRIRDDGLAADGVMERNLLIGGRGADTITGNSFKEELVIGGSTAFDTNLAALRAILDEWKSAAPLSTRVRHLRGAEPGGLNGAFVLKTGVPNATVFDDAIVDVMLVGVGPDWFFAADNDKANRGSDDILN